MGVRDLIFISCSHEDTVWLDRLRVMLKPYEVEGRLAVWADPYINIGDRRHREIAGALSRAAVGLLLVSPDFLASDFIRTEELPALLTAAERGELTLFCVPVSSCNYEISPVREYQWACDPEQPLDLLPDKGQWNRALVEIVRKLAQSFAGSPSRTVTVHAARVRAEPSRPSGRLGRLHNVPSLPPHYIVRSEDIARLKRSLLEDRQAAVGLTGQVAKVGLHGMGGTGKSVLACALAHDDDVRRAFPEGVFWMSVGQGPNLVSLQTEPTRTVEVEFSARLRAQVLRRTPGLSVDSASSYCAEVPVNARPSQLERLSGCSAAVHTTLQTGFPVSSGSDKAGLSAPALG